MGIGVINGVVTAASQSGSDSVTIPGGSAAWIDDDCGTNSGECWVIDVVVGDKTLQVAGAPSREQTIAIAKRVLGVT